MHVIENLIARTARSELRLLHFYNAKPDVNDVRLSTVRYNRVRSASRHWCLTRRLPSGKPQSQLTCVMRPLACLRVSSRAFLFGTETFLSGHRLCIPFLVWQTLFCLANTFLFDIDFANCFLFGIHFYRSASVWQTIKCLANYKLFGKQFNYKANSLTIRQTV